MTDCTDPASEIVSAVMEALRAAFDPASECPPVGGGKDAVVRFFGGDGIPMAAWNAHTNDEGCDYPFLWVRVLRRYRTNNLPTPTIDTTACGLSRAIALEMGVGRCATVEVDPTWQEYAAEAEISLDDSWRIEQALCYAGTLCRNKLGYASATDQITPYGPEGGVVAWMGTIYVEF